MVARLGPPTHDQLDNFVASPAWDGAPPEAVPVAKADAPVGGPDAVLVADDASASLAPCPRSLGVSTGHLLAACATCWMRIAG